MSRAAENTASRDLQKRTRPRGYIASYRPRAATAETLAAVDEVIGEYADFLPVTVRQIFYRLCARGALAKTEEAYRRLAEHVANARRGRRIPFDAIRDDGVTEFAMARYADPDDFRRDMRRRAQRYRRDVLADQDCYIEVWCEAAGMQGQLAAVSHRYSVQTYASGGFNSLSCKFAVAQRICAEGRRAAILHLGDCDPSGEAMFDSLAEDVAAFVAADRPHGLVTVDFERVALTAEQVETFELETAPPPASDSRSRNWQRGATCQLEALAPDRIAELLETAIRARLDLARMQATWAAEAAEREELSRQLLAGPTQ